MFGHSELIYSLGMGMCRRVDVTVVQGVTLMLFFVQGVTLMLFFVQGVNM